MKIVNEKPLSKIKEERENQEIIPVSLDALGIELAQEKIKNVQKDLLINSLGQQVALLKIDILQLKGGA
ncbi:hypothetical protein SLU01_19530 [Sporosarcina luteola]|uniref:Uncharacterized protein n=1 Tax=Sporosarcina luteola TaxID=582850 RepID=A0A511Z864_9BACL|nr:XkdW family protein [Sporosarcina luteola]GEN83641.1 hypothetical protein SLU01_19530 [Sporosarcina luteola]